MWEISFILRTRFQVRAVLVRDEYRSMLHAVWKSLWRAGRLGCWIRTISDTTNFLPFNPFEGLQVVENDQRQNYGVIGIGSPRIGERKVSRCRTYLRSLTAQTARRSHFRRNWGICFRRTKAPAAVLPQHTCLSIDISDEEGDYSPPIGFLSARITSSRKLVMTASPRRK